MSHIPVKIKPVRIFGKAEHSHAECITLMARECQVFAQELQKYFSGRKCASPEHVLRYITIFPEICSAFTKRILEDELALEKVRESPMAMYQTLIGDYDRASAEIEPYLVTMGNGELVVKLIEWALQESRTLRNNVNFYYRVVECEPFQARRLEKIFRSHKRDSSAGTIHTRTTSWCKKNQAVTAAGAYIYVTAHRDMPLRDYYKVILQNPFYSFRALLTLKDRHFNCFEMDYSRVSPRWAYHLLLAGEGLVNEDALTRILLKDPAWAVEYLYDSGKYKIGSVAEEWCRPLFEGNQDHPLVKHFIQWIRTNAAVANQAS